MHRSLTRLLLLGTALVSTIGISLGQSVTVKPVGTWVVKPSKPLDTTKMVPQINELPNGIRVRPENPGEGNLRQGVKNNLLAGNIGNFIRGNMTAKFPGPTFKDSAPPDCDMAVGPAHVITVVNSYLAIYTKDGTKVFEQPYDQFFAGMFTVDFLFDPKAFFDVDSGRYFVLCEEQDDTKQISAVYVAVSQTSNPLGTWFRYKFDSVQNASWLDFPGFAASKSNVVITGNMFPFGSGGEFGARVLAMPKAPMLTGGAVTVTDFFDPDSFTAQVARSHDGAANVYMASVATSTSARLFSVTGGATPTMVKTDVSIPAFNPPGPVTGPNGSLTNTVADPRITVATQRGTSIMAAHTIKVNSSDAGSSVRWYEFDTQGWPTTVGKTPKLIQSGNVSSSGEFYHEPGIAKNFWGDISLFFTRTSSSINGDLMFASRLKTDPAGQMGKPAKIVSSTGIVGANDFGRWGDYFATAIDPTDDQTFWGFGEYTASNNHWGTWVSKWSVTVGQAIPPLVAQGVSAYTGTMTGGSVSSVRTVNDGNVVTLSSVPVKGLGQVTALATTFTSPIAAKDLKQFSFTTTSSGPAGATLMVYAYNYRLGAYDWLKSVPQGTATTVTVQVPSNLSDYVSGSKEMKILVRDLYPTRGSVMPNSYKSTVDLVSVTVR